MKFTSSFLALASFCALATAKPAPSPAKPFGAVYCASPQLTMTGLCSNVPVINNDLDNNYVIAAQIGQDGLLVCYLSQEFYEIVLSFL